MNTVRMFEDQVENLSKSCETSVVDGETMNLLHASLGLAGEVGELVETSKKYVFYEQKFDHENAIEEIGDILFYLAMYAQIMGTDLEYCMEANRDKLNKRYPSGKFTVEDAKERLDKC